MAHKPLLARTLTPGCGLAPDYFELEPNGDLKLLREDARAEDADVLEQAILCCPTEAIALDT